MLAFTTSFQCIPSTQKFRDDFREYSTSETTAGLESKTSRGNNNCVILRPARRPVKENSRAGARCAGSGEYRK